MICIICRKRFPYGTYHECDPKAVKRFEAKLKAKNTRAELSETKEPMFGEQLADGFGMIGEADGL